MPLAIPAELKKISPFVRRAEELDRDASPESRLVAYYCRQYAVHTGIPLSGSSPCAKACLGHLLGNLESEKAAMDNFTRDEAAFLCRKFANQVFDKANGEDRMGLANKNTAKTFYAASTFLQVLEQFYEAGNVTEEQEEDRKKIIYAKWKSTEILKAIKEGRTPTPGGYGEDLDDEDDDDAKRAEDDSHDDDEPEKKEDAPSATAVETVESSEEENEPAYGSPEESTIPPLPPSTIPMTTPSVPLPSSKDEDDAADGDGGGGDEEEEEEEEVNVSLAPPPPAYPGEPDPPKVTFDLPPPPVPPPVPPPRAAPEPRSGGGGGLFGFGGGKKKKAVTKAEFADAAELTTFALAALQEKNAELASERLRQALQALGR